MAEGDVRIAVPGWTVERREALDFLLEDARINATWVSDTVLLVSPTHEQRVLALIEFVGSPGPEPPADESSAVAVVASAAEQDNESEPFPKWTAAPGLRLAGFLVDSFILGCVVGIPAALLFSGRARLAVALVASACYSVTLIGWRGQTLGNSAVKTRVLSVRTGEVPTFAAAAIRWTVFQAASIVSLFSGLGSPLYLLWLFVASVPILFTRRRQGLYDFAANVVVVDERVASASEQVAQIGSHRLPEDNPTP
jgi:uncharacterized RDD family membrane protein YckC